MSEDTRPHSLEDLWERLVTMRADQADLYRIVDKLRKRLTTTEAMVVALASTHPDPAPVLTRLRSWMDLAVDGSLNDELLAMATAERERVLGEWHALLLGAVRAEELRSATYH
jgi:hypothetical protein